MSGQASIFFGFMSAQTYHAIAELLLKARELKALNQPSNRDYESVLSFMENDGGQLYEEESAFIYEKADLVSLRPGRDYAWLDTCIESILKKCRCRLLTVSYVNAAWLLRILTSHYSFSL